MLGAKSIPFESDGSSNPSVNTSLHSHIHVMIADYQTELESEMSQLLTIQKDIMGTVSKLTRPTEHRIIYLRYIECKTWQAIADDIGYTYQHTVRLHGSALKHLQDVIECDTCK